jgi:hypothetical protein
LTRLTEAMVDEASCKDSKRTDVGRNGPTLDYVTLIVHVLAMSKVTIELESDAVKKLESARLSPQETFSDVVRRAEFPVKPSLARDLLEDFKQRAGSSPLSEEALDRLTEVQSNPTRSPLRWG